LQHKRKIVIILISWAFSLSAAAQVKFSLATDFSVQRSLRKEQQYWSFGQTVTTHFHFTPKDGAYAWLVYYSNGKFNNNLTATAKSAAITPQQISYRNNAALSFRQVSVGWRHYFAGDAVSEEKLSVYGYAGFGLMLGKVINAHSQNIDTSDYQVPVLAGTANFKRLTIDLGLGAERPIGGDVYLYAEARLYVPASDYPSRYILINNNAPLAASANIGFRILFN
jgi:hypothetical protein